MVQPLKIRLELNLGFQIDNDNCVPNKIILMNIYFTSFDESIRSSHPGLSSSDGNNTGETNGNLHDFVFIFWCISGKDKERICSLYLFS